MNQLPRRRVLIIDDEAAVRESLVEALSLARHFEFDAIAYECPADCTEFEKRGLPPVDISIVDLGFGPATAADVKLGHVGLRLLLARACLKSEGIAIVYSGHVTPTTIVKSMQAGAYDVVSKADYTESEFVDSLENLLLTQDRGAADLDRIAEYVDQNREELQNAPEWAGKLVAFVVDDQLGVTPVAAGDLRIEALLAYDQVRRRRGNVWPEDPHLIRIGGRNRMPIDKLVRCS
ncbi:MAG: hypothetical protein NT069_05365 [Planctomycetota bacterium]|nr:hypothetical protein [Planctomycetota bacterium]